MNKMQKALIIKDIKSITDNKRMLSVLIIVPFVMAVFLPTMFIAMAHFTPTDTDDFKALLKLLPQSMNVDNLKLDIAKLMLNNIIPLFFLLIPIMASSVMAGTSFIGEKEKRTLETLLYCPMSLKQIFSAKILASFILSMMVSICSFLVMFLAVEIEMVVFFNTFIIPDISWMITLLLISPAVSLLSIILIVRGSAKAQTVEESQQRSVFLIIPLILLVVMQFTGLVFINVWFLLIFGIIATVLSLLALRRSSSKFTYESLLQ